jgi:predicted outer membrane lipoprotein
MDRRLLLGLTLACALAPLLASGPAHADDKKRKKAGGESYLPMEPVSGASNKPGGRRGVMTVDCGIDIPDATLRARAEASLPRLRAAYAQSVQIYAAGLAPSAVPNVDFLALTLQRQTDQVLGKPGAKLLLGAVLIN